MIITCLRDRKSQAELAYLWLTVRHVSTLFKAEIEKLFIEYHLEKTTIYADCGKHPRDFASPSPSSFSS